MDPATWAGLGLQAAGVAKGFISPGKAAGPDGPDYVLSGGDPIKNDVNAINVVPIGTNFGSILLPALGTVENGGVLNGQPSSVANAYLAKRNPYYRTYGGYDPTGTISGIGQIQTAGIGDPMTIRAQNNAVPLLLLGGGALLLFVILKKRRG